jgi:PAB1-binding protein PBP1
VKFFASKDEVKEEMLNEAKGRSRDQFEENRKRFGTKTTYDPNLYTTTINQAKVTSAVEALADKIAAQLESKVAAHSIEEQDED